MAVILSQKGVFVFSQVTSGKTNDGNKIKIELLKIKIKFPENLDNRETDYN